jgi:hypothetical protein
MICRPCLALPCDAPDVLASGIDTALYSSLDFSFIEDCPTGCICQPGLFPRTISILASTIPPVIPPILEPGEQIILRLQGCSSLITRTLVAGSTQAQIAAAAQSMQAEWAGQQALCIAMTLPGVNCNPANADFITVCNDAQTGWCGDVVAAGTRCQRLQTAGLTQAQIDAATAQIKNNLNTIALGGVCASLLCPITVVTTSTPGVGQVNVLVTNVGPKTVDLSGLQFCDLNGGGTCFPPSPPIPPTSIAPHTGPIAFSGVFGPFDIPWSIKNFGMTAFNGKVFFGFTDTVTIEVGCKDT